jgi:hypothetical protein
MFEYIDGRGELISVRSAKSLPLLLAKGILTPSTLFREHGDREFQPASNSRILQQLRADLGLTWGLVEDSPSKDLVVPIERSTLGHKSEADVIAQRISDGKSTSGTVEEKRSDIEKPSEALAGPADTVHASRNESATTRGAEGPTMGGSIPIAIRLEMDENKQHLRSGRQSVLKRSKGFAFAIAAILVAVVTYFHEVIVSEYPASRPVFRATRLMPHMTEEGFTLRSGLRTEPDIRVLDPASLPPSIVVSGEVINASWVPRSIATLQVRMFDIRRMEIARQEVVASRRWIWPGEGVVFRADVRIGGVRPAEVILKLGHFE